jgi:phosphinothricin acetyltransferase
VGASTLIRPARAGDEEAVAAIYNEGIAERQATFETDPRSAADVAGWLDAGLPYLVAERDGTVIGFARVTPYTDRCVYAGVGEYGIYLARAARGQGAGARLLEALCAEAERAGLHKLTSKLFPANAASRALAARCGFREVGLHLRHARLDGEWRDVVVVERLLGEAANAPRSPASSAP